MNGRFLHRLAGQIGWPPETLRSASLAEFWAHVHGHGLAQGWFAPAKQLMTRDRLEELMEKYPDG